MKKNLFVAAIAAMFAMMVSCTGGTTTEETEATDTLTADTLTVDTLVADSDVLVVVE